MMWPDRWSRKWQFAYWVGVVLVCIAVAWTVFQVIQLRDDRNAAIEREREAQLRSVARGELIDELLEGIDSLSSQVRELGQEPDFDRPLAALGEAIAGLDLEGERGPVGPAGPEGEPGESGEPGETGEPGEPGEPGATGPIGPEGPEGETGPVGPPGTEGPQGSTGSVGPQGPQGETGATGAQGEPGRPPTAGEIFAAVERWFSENTARIQQMIDDAVDRWFEENEFECEPAPGEPPGRPTNFVCRAA